jgi:hypothetical protein
MTKIMGVLGVVCTTGVEQTARDPGKERYFEDRSAAEIARQLGVPEGTVRWRCKEALDRPAALLLLQDRRPENDWRRQVDWRGGCRVWSETLLIRVFM